MRMHLRLGLLVIALGVLFTTPLSAAEVLLKNSWISSFKNRVTMALTYKLEKAHKKPNPVGEKSDDGDMHLAGRSKEVGLPFVVEIVNAGLGAHGTVLESIKDLVADADSINIEGAWRLWFEHPAKKAQQQGATVPAPKNTNPPHVFEIHPVTKWGDDRLDESFVPIEGFTGHPAATAFGRFEKMIVTVTRGKAFTSFESKMIGFNYVDFTIVLTGPPKKVADGFMVLARIGDLDGKIIVNTPRRMVIAGDTAPAALIQTAKKGATFTALGIPRLNLERLMEKAETGKSVPVQGAYEMIIVGLTKS
jgi:hypothetical protein